MKIGRNAPCPCGSGKKYKQCCLSSNVTTSVELHYRRLSEAYDKLFDRLVDHAGRVFGEGVLEAAMDEFWLWPDSNTQIDDETLERQMGLFWPWFVFNWEYDALDPDVELHGLPDRTVAELYAQARGRKLDSLAGKLIQAANRKPYSFWEVRSVEQAKRVHMQDVLTGEEITVEERSGSQHLKPGDILFGRAVSVDGVGMIMGLSAYAIPPSYKPGLIGLRRDLQAGTSVVSDETLNDRDLDIRQVYLDVDRHVHTPPTLCNTDGDLLEMHKTVFEIDSADAAFDKLAHLCVTETADELRDQADVDGAGRIRRVEIPWNRKNHKASAGMTNTLLGRLIIDGNRLTSEVNSAKRAEKIRHEIETRLGPCARFRVDEIQNIDAMMDDEDLAASEDAQAQHEILMQDPEVKRQITEMLQKHWQGWVDTEVPALGGKTPRQAAKTPDGRESVEALLLDAERSMADDKIMGAVGLSAIEEVRGRLGLDEPDKPRPARARKADKEKEKSPDQVIRRMIEDFGREQLDETYTGFALRLCDRLDSGREFSLRRGRPEIWAAAIIHVIAYLNFLFDEERELTITARDLCTFFGVKQQTVANKALQIRRECDLRYGTRDFSAPDIVKMFNFVQTEEGLILPEGMLDGSLIDRPSFSPDTPRVPAKRTVKKKKPVSKPKRAASRKGQARSSSKPSGADRQMNLFEDPS
ncbi:MAG: SEC-C domain-containing protein [Deltaproteobacteria bacterium]|nr:SEC-C domain-containing protein [Deltaproteobacteria bacterium]